MKFIAIVLAASACLLAGCNTLRGVGQDMQKASDAIQNAVKK